MAANFTRIGQELQVNTGAVNLQQFDPDVTALTDGRFAIAYGRAFNTSDYDIYLQFANADGTLSGTFVQIDVNGGTQSSAAVAPRLGGGAVVVWRDRDGWAGLDSSSGTVSYAIQLRVVSSTGVLSAPMTVFDITAELGNPDVAMLADGRVVLVCDAFLSEVSNYDTIITVLDASGTSFSATRALETGTQTSTQKPAVAASGNDALIAVHDSTSGDIRVALFDGASGTLNIGATLPNILASSGDLSAPDVAALVDGRYIVVWENITNKHIEGRFVDAAGNPAGSAFTIAGDGNNKSDPQVAALPDGGFAVTWRSSGKGIVGERFDSSGASAGDLFVVNTAAPLAGQFEPAIAANPSTGRAFIAWTDYTSFPSPGDDNPPGVRGRAFQVTTDVVNGTPGNDTINTYSLSETIRGLAGNDTINAKGGQDDIDGGNGSDLIFAGSGKDTAAGGEGADTINGEDGDDTVSGGLGNDSLTGGPGRDSFLFNTKIAPKGSNVDTISDFSAPDDTIRLDNAIFTKLKTEGVLNAKFFEVGKKAKSSKDIVVYNDKNGDLIYDKNGDKKGGALIVAKLEGSPDDVSAADFLVI